MVGNMTKLSHQEHLQQSTGTNASCRLKWGIGATVSAVKMQGVFPAPLLIRKKNEPLSLFAVSAMPLFTAVHAVAAKHNF